MKTTLTKLSAMTSAILFAAIMFSVFPAAVIAGGSHYGQSSNKDWSDNDRFEKSGSKTERSGRKCGKKECDNSLSIPLYVKGDKRVGKVTVRLEGGDLKVTYQVNDGWYIKQTNLDLADSYNGLHLNSDGSPDVEAYPYKSSHFTPVKSTDYIISASQWPLGTELYVAAQAIVVNKTSGKCEKSHGGSHNEKDHHNKSHDKNGHSDHDDFFKKASGHDKSASYDDSSDDSHSDHNGRKQGSEKEAWAVGERFPGQTLAAYFIYKLESCDPVQPGTIQFSDAIYTVVEDALEAVITVTRTGNVDQAASVDFTTLDGSAISGSDYDFTSGVLTFSPGQTNAQFTVTPIDDTEVESVETVGLQLSNPVGATLGQQNTAILEIEDNDVAPTTVVEFSQAEYVYMERVPFAVITVVRSGDLSAEAQVDYTTTDGTAVAPNDYISTSGTLTFPPGVESITFQVRLINDREVESDETVLLELFNEVGASLGAQKEATLVIQDDDGLPS